MMSSIEIAQMLSAQNSMFMSQKSYAQQVGLPTGGGGFQRVPGAPAAPPVWNAGPGGGFGPGMQGGNAFAGNVMSGASAGMTGLGMVAGAASMMGPLSRAAPFLDPFSGAAAGFARAGLIGGVAGAAMPLALGSAAASFGHHFIQGGQQQQMVGNQLQQFQFANSSSRTGMGFTRDDAQAIGSQMRSLSHLPEMMSSMEELTRMLPKLKSSGMMQGVRDASEFAQRFKDSIKTIRDVSKVLGTTMEEAADFFAHSRGVGFLGRQAGIQNAMNVQFTSGVTGMSTGQVMQLQSAGAGMAQSMGAKRSLGAKATTNIAQSLGLAQQQGILKEGALEDVTGMQGPEAIQAASQRFAGVLANIAQSSAPGRLSMAGLVKFDSSGKALGIDEDLARQYREGSLSISDLKKRAGSLTRAQKVSFTARASDLAMDFAGKTGPQGISNLLSEAASQRYGNDPEAVNLLLQRQGGLSAGESDIFQSMQSFGGGESSMRSMMEKRARESMIRERTDPSAIMKRVKTKFHAKIFGGVEESGAKVFTAISKAYDDFVDDLVGRHVIQLSKEGAESFEKSMSAGGKQELASMFEAAHKMPTGGSSSSGIRGLRSSGMMSLGLANPLTAPMAATAIGANLLFRNSDMVRDSSVGGLLFGDSTSTGRSEKGKARNLKDLLGSASAETADSGVGGFAGQAEASEALGQIRNDISGFSEMDHDKRLEELRSRVKQVIGDRGGGVSDAYLRQLEARGGSAAALVRAGRAGQKAGISDFTTAVIAASQSNLSANNLLRTKFSSVADASSVRFNDVVKNLDERKKAADKGLLDAAGDAATTLRDRPDVRAGVRAVLEGKITQEEINSGDDVEVLKKLAEKGVHLKQEDLDLLRDTVSKTKNKKDAVLAALNTSDDVRRVSDVAVITKNAANLSASLSEAAQGVTGAGGDAVRSVSSALQSFSKDPTKTSYDQVQKSIGDLTSAIAKSKGKVRDDLVKAAGTLGEISNSTIKKVSGFSGATMGIEEMATKLGTSTDVLQQAGVNVKGKTTLSGKMLTQVEASIAASRGSSELAKKGDASYEGDKDKQLTDALKAMTASSKAQVELLNLLVTKSDKASAEAAQSVMKAYHENANAKPDGTAGQ